LPHHATGRVATAHAQVHAAAGDLVQRGERAGRDGHVARGRVGDAGAQTNGRGRGAHQREERVGLAPQYVRVEHPAVGEAVRLGTTCEVDAAVVTVIGLEGDPEPHWLLRVPHGVTA